MTTPIPHFTEPTTKYWQTIIPADLQSPSPTSPYQYAYPAVLPLSRVIHLPIRQLPNQPSEAVASLILNQASLSVVQELGLLLAELIRPYNVEVVIGLPTLGLSAAAVVAEKLGLGMFLSLSTLSICISKTR
jgi:hypothetical protein